MERSARQALVMVGAIMFGYSVASVWPDATNGGLNGVAAGIGLGLFGLAFVRD